jgi:thiosulfate/3-mercaptopyruvate sulfurtransferase
VAGVLAPIVDVAWLRRRPDAVVTDVRWYGDGRDPARAYRDGHLPGAVRIDLDQVLAAPASAAGRHPLPDPAAFAEDLGRSGIGDGDTVIAYDDAGGVIAARLVWMLRVLGHEAALLDGGLAAWDGPVDLDEVRRPPARRTPRPWPASALAGIDEVEALAAAALERGAPPAVAVLLDARPRPRYEGEPDALDPRAGHIPGARSLPCRDNLGPDGRLLAVHELRARLAAVGVGPGGPEVISSCGSGVTACHTLLVLERAGLPAGRLYPGSWSEWSRSDRPAVVGPDPTA